MKRILFIILLPLILFGQYEGWENSHFNIVATKELRLDGTGSQHTYIVESANDIANWTVGASIVLTLDEDNAANASNTFLLLQGTSPAHASGTPTDIWFDIQPTIGINTGAADAHILEMSFDIPAWATAVASNVRGIFIDPAATSGTLANATTGTNALNIFEIDAFTGDAQVTTKAFKVGNLTGTGATEYLFQMGTGWDYDIFFDESGGGVISSATSMEFTLPTDGDDFIFDEGGTNFWTVDRTNSVLETDASTGTGTSGGFHIDIESISLGDGIYLNATANALTSGTALKIESDATSADGYMLLEIVSSGSAAASKLRYGSHVTMSGASATNGVNYAYYANTSGASLSNYSYYSADGDLYFIDATASKPVMTLINTADDATAPFIYLISDRANPVDADVAGSIYFQASDGGGTQTDIVSVIASMVEVDDAEEIGKLQINVFDETDGSGALEDFLSMSGGNSVGGVQALYEINAGQKDIDYEINALGISVLTIDGATSSFAYTSNKGSSETITFTNTQGTSANAIDLIASAGGITAKVVDGKELKLGNTNLDAYFIVAASGTVGDEDVRMVNTNGTDEGAIELTSTAGGVDINANAAKDITLDAGQVLITATHDVTNAIYLHANAGGSEVIKIHADQGTGEGSIELTSDGGGLDVNVATGKNIDFLGGQFIYLSNENVASAVSFTTNTGVAETMVFTNSQGTDASAITFIATAGGIEAVIAAGKSFTIDEGGTDFINFDRTLTTIESDATTATAWQFDFDDVNSGIGMDIQSDANALSSGSLVKMQVATTAANASKVLEITSSGANASSTRTQYGLHTTMTGTGTSSTNVAAYLSASGSDNDYAIQSASGGWDVVLQADDAIVIDASTNPRTIDTGVMRFEHKPATTEDDTRAVTVNIENNNAQDTHAMVVNFTSTGLAAGEFGVAYDVNYITDGATGGTLIGYEVSASGTGTGLEVHGYHVDPEIEVISHFSGAFGALDIGYSYESSTFTDRTVAFNAAGTDVQIFATNGDLIYVAMLTKFSELEISLAIVASNPGIKPKFEYITDAGAWIEFTPNDNTQGFRQAGIIEWLIADLATWGVRTETEVTGAGGAVDHYWIRITRESAASITPPTEDLIQSVSTTIYGWTKDGLVYISKLEIDAVGNYLDVSTDFDFVSAADMVFTPTGTEVHIDGGLSVGDETDLGDNNFKVVGTSLLEGATTFTTAGVVVSAADGVMTFLGAGNGNDLNLIWDYDNHATATTIGVSSGAATIIDWGTIGHTTTGAWTTGDITITDGTPLLTFDDNTATGVDDLVIAQIDFKAQDSGSNDATFGYIKTIQNEVNDGDESGWYQLNLLMNNADTEFFRMYGAKSNSSTAFVEWNQGDIDMDYLWNYDSGAAMTLTGSSGAVDVVLALTSGTFVADTDITAGATAADEVRPTLSVVGDADTDGTTTSETIALTLVGNTDPTVARWTWTNTQGSGYTFDITGSGSTHYVEIIEDNEAGFLALGRTTNTSGVASMLSIVDGGSGDNDAGLLVLYDDAGGGNFFWMSTANVLRTRTTIPTDDDADGYAIIDLDDGTIGASGQPGIFSTLDANAAFTSLGIDDNATEIALTIEADEDVSLLQNLFLAPTKELLFDSGGGHTKISESGGDIMTITVGGDAMLVLTEATPNTVAISGNTTVTGTLTGAWIQVASTADNTESVTHNLGYLPFVWVYVTATLVNMDVEVDHTDVNTFVVTTDDVINFTVNYR